MLPSLIDSSLFSESKAIQEQGKKSADKPIRQRKESVN